MQGFSGLTDLFRDAKILSKSHKHDPNNQFRIVTTKISTNNQSFFTITLITNRENKIAGLSIVPEKSTPQNSEYKKYQTKTPLQLPFLDQWTVVWGGRELKQNYHAAYLNQRFAYDFLVMEDEKTHRSDGKSNSDYYCFGEQIVSAGAGKVIDIVLGVKDNIPGQMNPVKPTGNHVIIEHGNKEFSLYAHLKADSTKVSIGQHVKQGDQLGECGNSGNSSEAHLHFQLQNKPSFDEAKSIPAQFLNYKSNGKQVQRGEPIKSEKISQG